MVMAIDIARQAEFDKRPVTEKDVDAALEYIQFLHGDADGWIALFNKPLNGPKRTRCYKIDEITPAVLRDQWAGKVNSYVSLNTMFIPRRKNKNTRQLRAIGVDLDYRYVEGLNSLNHDDIIGLLERDYFSQKIPNPNVILHGYNIQLIYLLEPGPFKQTKQLWATLVRYFISVLRDFGADPKCKDYARVMRLPGSWHRNGMKITATYRHTYRYSLREMQEEYLPSLPTDWKEQRRNRLKKKRAKAAELEKALNPSLPGKHTIRTLNYKRMQDLEILCELRQWDVKGHREQILFLYRCYALNYYGEPVVVRQKMEKLNERFKEPYTRLEDTDSAEQMWLAERTGETESRRMMASNRSGVEYKRSGYNFRNQTLIEILEITAEEERQLSTIISEVEKQRRKSAREQQGIVKQQRAASRRLRGQSTREEYLATAERRRKAIAELKALGVSNRQIAKQIGCSEGEVRRLYKQIKFQHVGFQYTFDGYEVNVLLPYYNGPIPVTTEQSAQFVPVGSSTTLLTVETYIAKKSWLAWEYSIPHVTAQNRNLVPCGWRYTYQFNDREPVLHSAYSYDALYCGGA